MVLRWGEGLASQRMAPFELLLSGRTLPCPKQALAISPMSAVLGFYRMPLERAVRILASRANPLALPTPFFLDSPICACPRQMLRHSFPPLEQHPLKRRQSREASRERDNWLHWAWQYGRTDGRQFG